MNPIGLCRSDLATLCEKCRPLHIRDYEQYRLVGSKERYYMLFVITDADVLRNFYGRNVAGRFVVMQPYAVLSELGADILDAEVSDDGTVTRKDFDIPEVFKRQKTSFGTVYNVVHPSLGIISERNGDVRYYSYTLQYLLSTYRSECEASGKMYDEEALRSAFASDDYARRLKSMKIGKVASSLIKWCETPCGSRTLRGFHFVLDGASVEYALERTLGDPFSLDILCKLGKSTINKR